MKRLVVLGLLLAAGPVVAPASAAAPTCAGLTPTIVGTADDDTLVGTPGPDVIAGRGGQDRIDGGRGDDVLCGDSGADTLLGRTGNDRLYGGDNGLVEQFESEPSPGRDELVPGPGDDVVDLGPNTVGDEDHYSYDLVDYSDAATGVAVDLVAGSALGEGTDVLVVPVVAPRDGFAVEVEGSAGADVLLGTEGPDVLIGNGGGDRVEGRGGDDLLLERWDEGTYDSDDVYDGGAGDDDLSAGGGDDVSRGGPGRDWVRDEGGIADAEGGGGHDTMEIYFSPRSGHLVDGGPGRDEVNFGVSFSGTYDRVRGTLDLARERIAVRMPSGTRWSGTVRSVRDVSMPSGGRWRFVGSSAAEHVTGGTGYTAYGRGGDDRLDGSFRDDLLVGGAGRDVVRGQGGVDTCRAEDERGCER